MKNSCSQRGKINFRLKEPRALDFWPKVVIRLFFSSPSSEFLASDLTYRPCCSYRTQFVTEASRDTANKMVRLCAWDGENEWECISWRDVSAWGCFIMSRNSLISFHSRAPFFYCLKWSGCQTAASSNSSANLFFFLPLHLLLLPASGRWLKQMDAAWPQAAAATLAAFI